MVTGELAADGLDFVDREIALVVGPFSVQAEYPQSFVIQSALDDPRFFGWDVQTSDFLTGEHRPYDTEKARSKRREPGGKRERVPDALPDRAPTGAGAVRRGRSPGGRRPAGLGGAQEARGGRLRSRETPCYGSRAKEKVAGTRSIGRPAISA